jgi:hypothetical protein
MAARGVGGWCEMAASRSVQEESKLRQSLQAANQLRVAEASS